MQEIDIYIKKGDVWRAPASLLQKGSEKRKSSKGKDDLDSQKK